MKIQNITGYQNKQSFKMKILNNTGLKVAPDHRLQIKEIVQGIGTEADTLMLGRLLTPSQEEGISIKLFKAKVPEPVYTDNMFFDLSQKDGKFLFWHQLIKNLREDIDDIKEALA